MITCPEEGMISQLLVKRYILSSLLSLNSAMMIHGNPNNITNMKIKS